MQVQNIFKHKKTIKRYSLKKKETMDDCLLTTKKIDYGKKYVKRDSKKMG